MSWVIVRTFYTYVAVKWQPSSERLRFRVQNQTVIARQTCRILGIHVSKVGTVPRGEGMLYVCNHLTAMDPVLIAAQVPICFAGKSSIAKWPVLGWICRTYGMLLVQRDRATATKSFVDEILGRFSSGVSLLVFPEGTTGWGQELGPFKTGAFEAVSERADGRVLPLFLDITVINGESLEGASGRYRLSHNHDSTIAEHMVRIASHRSIQAVVRVGNPIEGRSMDRKELASAAHAAVAALAETKDMPNGS